MSSKKQGKEQSGTNLASSQTAQSLVAASREVKAHIGPLPPPEMLDAYEQVRPGLKDEIVESWKKERDHRHWMEKKIVETDRYEITVNAWTDILGQLLAFGCVLVLIGAAVWINHPWASPIISVGGLALLVWNIRRDPRGGKK